MEQLQVNRAIVDALKDPATVNFLATAVSKQLIEQKSKISNDEEKMVQDHVIFAQEGDASAKYMVSAEIKTALEKINPNTTLRTRTLGKALLASCVAVKQTNKGKAYLVTDIVADIKDYVPAADSSAEALEIVEEAFNGEVVAEVKKKSKKDKKKDKGKKGDEKKVPKIEPEEAFEDPEVQPLVEVDSSILMAVANDFQGLDEYAGFLKGKSRQGLIKHINKAKLPIRVDGYEDEAVVVAILRLFEANLPIGRVESKEGGVQVADEAFHEKVAVETKKKGKKKDKNKSPEIDVEELNNLSKKGKKKKNKKGNNKKSKK
jgi:hypothetical protein